MLLTDAALTSLIESVSDEMEDYVEAWLAPRPPLVGDPDVTFLFDVERTNSGSLRMKIANRAVGVRSLSAFGIASTGQPESGGSYTTVTPATVLLRPRPTSDTPASAVVLPSPAYFTRGFNTVTATGRFGPPAVLPRVRETAIQLVLLDLGHNYQGITSESTQSESRSYGDLLPERHAILFRLDSLATWAI